MLLLAQVHGFAVPIVAAAAKTTTKGSGTVQFIFIIGLFAVVYFFYLRPRRAKLLARQRAANPPVEIQPGDTVVTTSGIIGRVLSMDGDRASIEIAPDTVVEFHRSALGRRLEPDAPAPDEGDRWASLTTDEHGNDTEPHTGDVDKPTDPSSDGGDSGDSPSGGAR